MGADFMKRINKSFHRALDRGAVALRTPHLLSAEVSCINRTALGNIVRAANLAQGERVMVRELGGKLVAQRGNEVVLEFDQPPASYADHVREGGGIELGEVQVVHSLAQTAEVSFCD